MDSNRKLLPSPPPPPPPPPPKNGNTRGRPPLISAKLHDEGDGGAIGGDMEATALSHGSLCAPRHELSGSGRRAGETKLAPRSLVCCLGRDEATAEQRGLQPRRSREVARLGLASLNTVAAVDDRTYACADCSMTFGRETALSGHMKSHKRDHLSSESEEDAPTPKRRRKKRKSKLRTVKPLEVTWGNTERRNGSPKDTVGEEQPGSSQGTQIQHDLVVDGVASPAAVEVKVSRSESNVTVHNIAVAMHDSNEVPENNRGGDDNFVIIIDDDDDDDTNPVIVVAGSRGAPGRAPDAAAALTMAPAPAVAVATPTPPTPRAAASVPIEGAPAAASTAVVRIPPAPAPVSVAAITRALATAMSVATQIAPDPPVQGNNGSSEAGARYGYGGKSLAAGYGTVDNGKAVAGYSNAGYGSRGVSSHSSLGYGKGVAGCSSGGHTYSTSTAAGGESSKKGSGKVYNCRMCKDKNMFFYTPQALGGHVTRCHSHRITKKKDKEKLDLQSGPHKCKVCNHVSQTGPELSFHMRTVHPYSSVDAAAAAAAKGKTLQATGINNIGAAVDGPSNTMGWRFPAGATESAILALLASRPPMHQQPQGTMAMAGNPVTGHFSAANTSTGWSLPGPATTSSILPAIPLHNQQQNPPEQIAAVAPSNLGYHSINPALFPFSWRQERNPLEEMAMLPSNAIASSSSTPRPGLAAATDPSQAIGINNYFAAIDAPANTMGRCLPFFLAGRSDTQAFPVSRLVHHQTQGMAMDGNPLTSHFPAAISATGWSFPATTNSLLPSIPLQNQDDGCRSINPTLFSKVQEKNPPEEIAVVPSNAITSSTSTPHPSVPAATEPSQAIAEVNSNVEAIDALANAMRRMPFFLTGRSAINAPPVSMPVHQPTQGLVAMARNPVAGHFPAANACSVPATTSSVLPAITQEDNPPQGRVVPVNGEHPSTHLFGSNSFPIFPSQNQAENPREEVVPGNNNGGRKVLLFGRNIAEDQKEIKEPKK